MFLSNSAEYLDLPAILLETGRMNLPSLGTGVACKSVAREKMMPCLHVCNSYLLSPRSEDVL